MVCNPRNHAGMLAQILVRHSRCDAFTDAARNGRLTSFMNPGPVNARGFFQGTFALALSV